MSNNNPKADPAGPINEDAPGRPFLVADSGETGDGGKFKMIGKLVKKYLGYCGYVRLFSFSLLLASALLIDDFLACLTTTLASFATCITSGAYPKFRVLEIPRYAGRIRCVESFLCVRCMYALIEGGRINDSPHPFEKMLAVVRFTLTNDFKFVVYSTSTSTFLLTLPTAR